METSGGPLVAASGEVREFPLHGGARTSYTVVAVLLILLVVTIPIAVWIFIAGARARIQVTATEFHARGVFLGNRWNLQSLRRLGVLRVPIYAIGIGGMLARKKVGGDHAIHLCSIDDQGKKRNFLVSMYAQHDEIIKLVAGATRLPLEAVEVGAFGPKWANS